MKIKDKLVKIILVLLLGSVAINLSSIAMSNCITHPYGEKNTWACGPSQTYESPNVSSNTLTIFGQTTSDLLGYVFQLIFILFFISPPIIALMLFLIWKELKERNKMK